MVSEVDTEKSKRQSVLKEEKLNEVFRVSLRKSLHPEPYNLVCHWDMATKQGDFELQSSKITLLLILLL